jgi:hypothetical protein
MNAFYKIIKFPSSVGFLSFQFSQKDLEPVNDEIFKILKNFKNANEYNDQLIGHIDKEFEIIDSKKYLESLLMPFAVEYDKNFNYISTVNTLTSNVPLVLDNCWVNFQKKSEFNPIHNHSGIFSFVIWLKIPYSEEKEMMQSPGKKSIKNLSGKFSFHYTDILGGVASFDVNDDIFQENTMILFPSKLSHSVFPFYSSDEYRISISGNLKFKV